MKSKKERENVRAHMCVSVLNLSEISACLLFIPLLSWVYFLPARCPQVPAAAVKSTANERTYVPPPHTS